MAICDIDVTIITNNSFTRYEKYANRGTSWRDNPFRLETSFH